MQTALARHDELINSSVEGSNGQVAKTTGDGFLAVFDSAQDGLNACIRAQRSLREENWEETGPPRVRMGLYVGEVQQRGGDYFGTTVNRAARIIPELFLIKSDLLLAMSPENTAKVREILTRTLLTIRQTEGQVVALRAATKLCNLEVQTGSAVESGRILAEIYEGFTEGFETAVLVEAKRVLDQRQG